jgi:hypothetical protein
VLFGGVRVVVCFLCNVLYIIVFPFVLFLLTIILFVLIAPFVLFLLTIILFVLIAPLVSSNFSFYTSVFGTK